MQRQKQLTFFTQSYSQASVIFPYLMVSPAYFSGAMQLGGLMQTASAFNSVQNALSYFINAYQSIAQYQAVCQRLSGFEDAIVAGREVALTPPVIEVLPGETANAISIDQLHVRLPKGEPLVNAEHIVFAPGERVLVTGPSGAGKSTLFRAHHRDLAVRLGPRHACRKTPRSCCCRSGPIFRWRRSPPRSAIRPNPAPSTMPASPKSSPPSGCRNGADGLAKRRTGTACCRPANSSGLAIARALLQEPDYLFLDEATASLDEAAEAVLYRLLAGTAQGDHHHLDRPPLDARRLPPPPRRSRGGRCGEQVRDVPLVSAAE